MITLVLGGEKSGKSDFALELLLAAPAPRLFVATGKALDPAFREQIRRHRQERPADIPVAEAGADLAGVLAMARGRRGSVLVDSLDFWLFACRQAPGGRDHVQEFLACLDSWDACTVILVSAEIGLGPIAASAETRAFVRALGELNRAVARRADTAWLVAAGLPLQLKQAGGP